MKKFSYLFAVILAVAIFSSCTKDSSNPNFLKVGSDSYSLNTGYIDNTYSSNLTATPHYRPYGILLQDKEVNPSTYLMLRIYSTSTTELAAGTYTYTFSSYAAGKFSWVEGGFGLAWDSQSVATAGTFFSESSTGTSGTVTISTASNGNFVFDINLQQTVNGTSKTITGKFSEVLTESSYFPIYQ